MSEINTSSNVGCPDCEKDESSYASDSSDSEIADQKTQFSAENSETDQEEIFLESCAEKIAMLPIEIAIASFPDSLTENGDGFPVPFPYHLIFFMSMLSFYASVSGIIIWPVFPKNGSPDLEQGKPSKPSESHGFTSSESTKKESTSKLYMCILQATANKIAIMPFDIATTFLAASWGTQNGNSSTACFPNHLILLMLTLGFYSSVNGKILRLFFPKAARGFYLVASLCILLAVTTFFASVLPSNLRDVPWIFLTFLVLGFGLAIYEECRLN
ncbi:hypothetical protein OWV82_020750 [Melia azedarach]|uniref:Uncharacterized protein n=1 Tax=Melia azedarach TaxID=155640 RepID=A0ACC1X721_MELAZ|nr:hypothetical protein OWV82_020750 [Melia azedarach]